MLAVRSRSADLSGHEPVDDAMQVPIRVERQTSLRAETIIRDHRVQGPTDRTPPVEEGRVVLVKGIASLPLSATDVIALNHREDLAAVTGPTSNPHLELSGLLQLLKEELQLMRSGPSGGGTSSAADEMALTAGTSCDVTFDTILNSILKCSYIECADVFTTNFLFVSHES